VNAVDAIPDQCDAPAGSTASGTQYFLAEQVYFCTTAHGAVFLDLREDKYFGVDAHLLNALREQAPLACEEARQLAVQLLERAVITLDRNQGKDMSPVRVEPAQQVLFDIDDETPVVIRPHHVARFLAASATAALRLKSRRLQQTLHEIRLRKQRNAQRAPAFDVERVRQLIRIYRFLCPLVYGARDRCLFDSCVVVEFLAAYLLFPTWVFGVSTAPFMAHCWVQHSGYLLNDNPMRVSCYTPIMAV
jgi:hypothetical protein